MIMDRNEAIDIVKKNWSYDKHQLYEALETLIPELKESEDNRIRKQILDCFRTMKQQGYFPSKHKEQYDSWIAWLEKQGSQNLANSEKTFKIGDWIISDEVHQDYHICQITDIDDNKYYIESIEGYKGFNYFDVFEKLYRQWTIQDAKDGDVLTTDMVHFIFKSKDEMEDCYMHCYYSVLINKYVTSYTAIVDSICVHPATKEQRDLLFRKMKESGYEWDAEKKELNEIEPKSALSEEDINTLNRVSAILVNASEVKNWWKKYRLIEKDEMIRLTDFLKSLKDRCTWKPSDKQMEQLGWIAEQNKNNMIGQELMTLYNDLKKLKE